MKNENKEPAVDDILLNEISILTKRIIVLKSTIKAYQRLDKTKEAIITAIEKGHELDIKNNYVKK